MGAPLGITSTPISSVTGPFVSVAAADAAQNAASAEQSAVARVFLCFIVVPPYALRSSGLTISFNCRGRTLSQRLASGDSGDCLPRPCAILMLFCANVPRWPSSSAKGRYCRDGAVAVTPGTTAIRPAPPVRRPPRSKQGCKVSDAQVFVGHDPRFRIPAGCGQCQPPSRGRSASPLIAPRGLRDGGLGPRPRWAVGRPLGAGPDSE